MVKVAINGFGRIGRPALKRIISNHPDLDLVAINDLSDAKTLAHLLKYDSIYGVYNNTVKAKGDSILIDGKTIKVFAEKDPVNLPWKDLKIDIVLECSGLFTTYDLAKKHLDAGAKKVIISAPSKDQEKVPSFVLGVNEKKYDPRKDDIVDMGSCTTNCLAPVTKVLNDNFGIAKGFMSTVHSYTNSQKILDLAGKDIRESRAAGLNIIPTTTGAAKTINEVVPEVNGKLNAISFRVPTPTVSVIDLVCELKKDVTSEEINYAFKKASQTKELEGVLGIEDAELVSSDYVGNCYSAIVDSSLTMAIGNLVKVVAWYDNEWGYACRLAEFTDYIGKKLK